MIEQDTIKLLRECDAGIKMGVSAIDEVIDSVTDKGLCEMLETSRRRHCELKRNINELLADYGDTGKEPNPMAKGMSKMKTGFKMAIDTSDATIADLITDGCNMGVKSLSKYLNQYAAADERSKSICKCLITIEESLGEDMRSFL